MKVFVTGGSGYLGQFLVRDLASSGHTVAFSYLRNQPRGEDLQLLGCPSAFPVDLATGNGLDRVLAEFGLPDAVVNTAAMSTPRDCERDPEGAFAVNVPSALLAWLAGNAPGGVRPPLLVHLSTDQVFEGTRSYYSEADELKPVNKYGESKVAAEAAVQKAWSNFAILRTSIITGPQPPIAISKGLPLQWMDSVLSEGKFTDFFEDEFRNPVYVKDVVKVIQLLVAAHANGGAPVREVFNVGGPERLSRADMALGVARARGHDPNLIKRVPAGSVNRGVASPADISMDISHLVGALGVTMTPFGASLVEIFQ